MNQLNIGRMQIIGYRRLANVEVDFTSRNLAVLVGANGSGKTSFLKSFDLLSCAAVGELRPHLSSLGGLGDVLTRGSATSLGFLLEVIEEKMSPLRYRLEIAPKGVGYEIVEETLTEQQRQNKSQPFIYVQSHGSDIRYFDPKNRGLVRPTWQHNPLETSLAQVPRMYERPETFRQQIASFSYYGPLDVAPNSPIRLPQTVNDAQIPKANGDETISALYNMQQRTPEAFEELKYALRVVFPDFQNLTLPGVATGKITALWWEGSGATQRKFYISELSEGTVRFLWLCTVLLSEELPQVLVIDEPESSLHPAMLRVLVELLREASQRTLLIVATHSERLLSHLQPNEVLIADQEDGNSTVTWADQKGNLDHWLEDYTLGELWAMNILGGRP